MFNSLSLMLLEGLFIETVILIVITFSLVYSRKSLATVKQKYRDLKNAQKSDTNSTSTSTSNAAKSESHAKEDTYQYLTRNRDLSTERFRSQSGQSAVKLTFETPLAQKVSSLRSLYLNAECDAFPDRQDPKKYWHSLEQKLRPILAQITPPPSTTHDEKDTKIELLKERLERLENIEDKALEADKQLATAQQRISRLESINKNTQDSINRIREINHTLNRFGDIDDDNRWMQIDELDKGTDFDKALNNVGNANGHLSTITDINRQKWSAIESILDEISDDDDSVNTYKFDQLKAKVKALEDSLQSSDHEVTSLNGQINKLEASIVRQRDQPEDAAKSHTEPDMVITLNNGDGIDLPPDRQQTLGQINNLQDNNSSQRNMITDLRREIMALETDIDQQEGLTQREIDEKNAQIEKLNQLIKECDHCISALESEVEMLYQQMENLNSTPSEDTSDGDEEDDSRLLADIEKLNAELQQMSDMIDNTMALHNDQTVLSNLTMDCTASTDFKGILLSIDKAIRGFSVTPGIDIRTKTANCHLIPEADFSADDINQLKTKPEVANNKPSAIDEKLLYATPTLSLIITDMPTSHERAEQVKDALSMLMNIATNEIQRFDANETNKRQKHTLDQLLTATQQELVNIDVQQSHQTNEFNLILNKLLKEAYKITKHPITPKPMVAAVSHVIKETQEHSAVLFATGSLVTDKFSDLIDSLKNRSDDLT